MFISKMCFSQSTELKKPVSTKELEPMNAWRGLYRQRASLEVIMNSNACPSGGFFALRQ